MEFLQRTTRLMGWLGLILVPLTAVSCGLHAAVGLASGMVWAWANAWALARLVRSSVHVQHRWKQVALWIVKLPFLYVVGALCLLSPWSSSLGFLTGFSLWFVMLVVSALHRTAV